MHVTVSSYTNYIFVSFAAKGPGFQEMEACSLFINLRKGMQSSSKQPLVGEEHCVTTLITAAKGLPVFQIRGGFRIKSPTATAT